MLALLCNGCMNISASLQPENAGVQGLRESSDCMPIIFGFAYGVATVEGAMAEKAPLIKNYNEPHAIITRVKSISLHDYTFLFFGARCIEIVGE